MHAFRFSPRLARLIAAALLMQWLAVFAPLAAEAAAPAASLHLEICTPDGLRSIELGGEAGAQPKAPPCLVHCALMLAPQAAPPPVPLALPLRRQPALALPLPAPSGPAERAELPFFFLARAPPAA
ncbi:hypothetical protein NON00_13170 [Roseomonas sp. GC11]|uniref:hypothetical protein n=1 Tax=Roseomonas sp. GC11 TaxID=2950546 RepID=UPI00210B4BF6|nr:hypothetical protein [Roseomonas sp. GC11]MCQ4160879.1 hypothetical protein [Roseomonas sp. GC11]